MLPPEIIDPNAAGSSPDASAGAWDGSDDSTGASALAYNCQVLGVGSPSGLTELTGDSLREYIGFFLQPGATPVAIAPALCPEGYGVQLTQFLSVYEIRYSSHGPMVRDSWTIDALKAGASVLVITISPSGQ